MSRRKKNTTGIPDYEIDSLARALLPQYKHSLKQKKEKESLKNGKRKNKNDN